MADRAVLPANTRTVLGKKVKNLRRAGRIPATVYGYNVQPASIDVEARAFRVVHSSAGDSQLVDLVVDGAAARPVLIHSTQIDPRRNTAMHVEFYQANLLEKLTARIPLHHVGEAPAIKLGLTVLSVLDAVEVECLPTDLPAFIEVDYAMLEDVGSTIHVRDLVIDEAKCEIKTDLDEVVAVVSAPTTAAEEEAEEAAAASESAQAAAEAASTEAESAES